MKFSENKFKSLSFQRQNKKIKDLIKEIFKNWQFSSKRYELIKNLQQMLLWLEEKSDTVNLLIHFLENDIKLLNLRLFDKYATPFLMEQEQNINENLIVYQTDFTRKVQKMPLYLILDNLRSVYNVGAIFRSAECFGVSKIYCIGYTPTPEHKGIKKSAMGTELFIEWEQYESVREVLKILREKNTKIYALELTSQSIDINDFEPHFPSAIILGNEALGISKENLMLADKILHIPLYGNKNSLNVASAAAVALNRFVSQYVR